MSISAEGRHKALVPPANSFRTRIAVFAAFFILLVALADGSTMRGVGDAAEYMTMADRIAHFHQPNVTPAQIDEYNKWLSEIGGYWGLGNGNGTLPIPQENGRYAFYHFFTYPALAAPFLAVVQNFDMNPIRAFTALNMVLLLGGLWVVMRRLHWLPAVLVFAGPAFWWVDKVHSELFTFSLMAVAMTFLFSRRPVAAMLVFGVLASQNFPIAVGVAVAWVVAIAQDRSRLRSIRFWLLSALSGVIAISSIIYYEAAMGVFSAQEVNNAINPGLPPWVAYIAPITDLNIGVIVAAPILSFLALLALGMLIGVRRQADWLVLGLSGAMTLWFLFSFAQTTNINHGATPSMTRYGLWLLPMTIGLFVHLQQLNLLPMQWAPSKQRNIAEAAFGGLVALSILLSIVTFHPKIEDGLHRPTKVASYVWNNHPGWNNPPPEVFLERIQNYPDFSLTAAALPNCAKVFSYDGNWPSHCGTPPELPDFCNDGCYANRSGDDYRYVRAHATPEFFASLRRGS